MSKFVHWTLICASGLLISCNSSKSVSVRELKRFQDNDGLFSKSLFYCGSTRSKHFFEQDQLLAALLPWPFGTDGVRRYKVNQQEMGIADVENWKMLFLLRAS